MVTLKSDDLNLGELIDGLEMRDIEMIDLVKHY